MLIPETAADGLPSRACENLNALEYIRFQEERLERLKTYFQRTNARLQKAALLARMKDIVAETRQEVLRRRAAVEQMGSVW